LFGTSADSIELESDNLITLRQFEADLLHWRKKGAVGKPHHVAKIFRVSTQRTEAFKRHAKEMEDEERCLQVVGGVECRARAYARQQYTMELDIRRDHTCLGKARGDCKLNYQVRS
jgi:hypothetical protein